VLDQMLALAKQADSRFAGRINKRRLGISGPFVWRIHDAPHPRGGRPLPCGRRACAGRPRERRARAHGPRPPADHRNGRRAATRSTPIETAGRAAFALLDGPRFLVELLNTGPLRVRGRLCRIRVRDRMRAHALRLDRAHELTLRYAFPFLPATVRGRNVFPPSLRLGGGAGRRDGLEAHGQA
jgi:hypothetical protein